MDRELKGIIDTFDRVRAGCYSLPARVRLLEDLNDRLTALTDHELPERTVCPMTVAN